MDAIEDPIQGGEDRSPDWSPYRLEWRESPPFVTGVVHWRQIPIARVYLVIEGDLATLQDIVVLRAAPIRTWMPWWFGHLRERNFQHCGIGSRLLAEALQRARRAGAASIEGLVTQPTPWLLGWYERAGFKYDPVTSIVRRSLVDRP